MTSFQKTISLLSLFSDRTRQLSVEQMADLTGLPISTLYRYIRNLQEAGLLVQVRPGVLSLGPRIAELDRLMRISDPLLVASNTVFPEYLDNIRPSALLLSRYAGNNTILTIRAEASSNEGHEQRYLRERGIPYSPLKGASSLVILAFGSTRMIGSAYASDPAYVAAAGMGCNLAEFWSYLADIRRQRHAVTRNTFRTGRTSVAIPIFEENGYIEASLARLMENTHFDVMGRDAVLDDLKRVWRGFERDLCRGQAASMEDVETCSTGNPWPEERSSAR